MLKKITFIFLFAINIGSWAQSVGINPTGAVPNSSAGLDIDFTNKGLLIPRTTSAQRSLIASPATSLLIFNTTTNCFETYGSGVWQSVFCLCTTAPSSPVIISGSAKVSYGQTGVIYSVVP